MEQLKAMTDDELNELAAVKVMEKLYQNGKMWEVVENTVGHRLIGEWNPTGDMNDAMELLNKVRQSYTFYIFIGDKGTFAEIGMYRAHDFSTPRVITIAAILAKASD